VTRPRATSITKIERQPNHAPRNPPTAGKLALLASHDGGTGQRESATESRFEACMSLLTSQATRRTPPKCGVFRFQPRGSPLRQTGCWREPDSPSVSRGRIAHSSTVLSRFFPLLRSRRGQRILNSSSFASRTVSAGNSAALV
jgi:hypothetical protein